MKKVIIDTNVYSDAMRGIAAAIAVFQRNESILFSPVVIGELFAGFRRGQREEQNKLQLKEFLLQERISVLSISEATADFYGYLLQQLRDAGTPIPTNDIWIAASAMEHGAGIATLDAHFFALKGIQIIKPE
jgi:predicted nucleic acid-binding protein